MAIARRRGRRGQKLNMGVKIGNDPEGSATNLPSRWKRFWYYIWKKQPNVLTVILISLFIAILNSIVSPLWVHWWISPKVNMKYGLVHTSHGEDGEHFTITVHNTGNAHIPHKAAELKLQFKSDITNITWLSKPVRGTAEAQCMGNAQKPFFYSLVFGRLSPKGTLKFRIYSKDVLHTEPKLLHAGNFYGMSFCEAEGNYKNQLCGGQLESSDFADNLKVMKCPKATSSS